MKPPIKKRSTAYVDIAGNTIHFDDLIRYRGNTYTVCRNPLNSMVAIDNENEQFDLWKVYKECEVIS